MNIIRLEKKEDYNKAYIYKSPIGDLILTTDNSSQYITSLEFTLNDNQNIIEYDEPSVIKKAKKELDNYFSNTLKIFTVPLAIYGTDFQYNVWIETSKIPFGNIITYSDIAKNISDRKGSISRAVGMTEGKNKIAKGCKIGPFARLRGDVELGEGVKIGNFVEIKKSKIKAHTNVCHLSYVGDSTLGSNVNIGAGTITANYNHITKEKFQTVIDDNASTGSNSVIVAPAHIGENASIGAGSVISKDVEANALGLTRAPLRIVKDWFSRMKK